MPSIVPPDRMPELPEVEVLARHLQPLIRGKTIRRVEVRRDKSLRPTLRSEFQRKLAGATFKGLSRRGKYLLFELSPKRAGRNKAASFFVLGHLGMTGRMYVARKIEKLPKHAAVVMDLGDRNFIYE